MYRMPINFGVGEGIFLHCDFGCWRFVIGVLSRDRDRNPNEIHFVFLI